VVSDSLEDALVNFGDENGCFSFHTFLPGIEFDRRASVLNSANLRSSQVNHAARAIVFPRMGWAGRRSQSVVQDDTFIDKGIMSHIMVWPTPDSPIHQKQKTRQLVERNCTRLRKEVLSNRFVIQNRSSHRKLCHGTSPHPIKGKETVHLLSETAGQ
jgi:hypothetical protein